MKKSASLVIEALNRKSRHSLASEILGCDDDCNDSNQYHDKFNSKQKRRSKKRRREESNENNEDEYLPASLSRKILKQADLQLKEIEEEEKEKEKQLNKTADFNEDGNVIKKDLDSINSFSVKSFSEIKGNEDYSTTNSLVQLPSIGEIDSDSNDDTENTDISKSMNLADLIMNKIRQNKTNIIEKKEIENVENNTLINQPLKNNITIDSEIQNIFIEIGKILSTYKSGKIPRALRCLGEISSSNQQELLLLTSPEKWSPNAVYEVTRIFASNMSLERIEIYYKTILLEHFCQDIDENKRLNFHLFRALKKALFKPSAFFKGIILPLIQNGGCSNRQILVLSTILSKSSIPMLHSAAALHMLVRLPLPDFSATNYGLNNLCDGSEKYLRLLTSIVSIIKALLAKKYSMPPSVISSIAHWFIQFGNVKTSSSEMVIDKLDEDDKFSSNINGNIGTAQNINKSKRLNLSEKLSFPVVQHQTLLIFVQNYASMLNQQQKLDLKDLIKHRHHHLISNEINRFL